MNDDQLSFEVGEHKTVTARRSPSKGRAAPASPRRLAPVTFERDLRCTRCKRVWAVVEPQGPLLDEATYVCGECLDG